MGKLLAAIVIVGLAAAPVGAQPVDGSVGSEAVPGPGAVAVPVPVPGAVADPKAPGLREPPAVVIEIIDRPFMPDLIRASPLVLEETSWKGRLTGLSARQTGAALHEGKAVGTRLEVAAMPAAIEPGAAARVVVVVRDAPLGTTTGNLVVKAAELAQPVTVAVTVSRRQWDVYVLLLFLIGGITGYLVRTSSQRVLRRASLRRTGDEQLPVLAALAARSVPAERARVQALAARIRAAATADDLARLAAALDEVSAVVAAATEANRVALADQQRRLDGHLAIETMVDLPGALVGLTRSVRDFNAATRAAIERGEAPVAEARLLDTERHLHDALTAARPELQTLGRALDDLGREIEGAPGSVRTIWREVLPVVRPLAEAERVAPVVALTRLDQIGSACRRALDATVVALDVLVASARERLVNGRALATQLAQVGDVTIDELSLHRALGTVAEALHKIRKVIVAAAQPTAAMATVIEQLGQGDYLAALAALDPLLTSTRDDAIAVAPRRARALAAPRIASVAAATMETLGAEAGHDAPPLVTPRVSRLAWLARAGQVTFAFVVLPLAAYLTYGPSFVGTRLEIAALLATAFLTDFTLDAAVTAVSGLKRKP